MMLMKKAVTLSIDEDVAALIRDRAAAAGISVSAFAEKALYDAGRAAMFAEHAAGLAAIGIDLKAEHAANERARRLWAKSASSKENHATW